MSLRAEQEKIFKMLRLQKNIPGVFVVGSFAKENFKEHSDVDLLLICNEELTREKCDQYLRLAQQFYGWVDVFIIEGTNFWVRNDDASGWKKITQQKELRAELDSTKVPLEIVINKLFSEKNEENVKIVQKINRKSIARK